MKRLLLYLIGLILIFNLGVFVFLMIPPTGLINQMLAERGSQKVVDRNGALLFEVLRSEKGRQTYLSFDQIPTPLKQAFLSAEDQRFYEHSGVDWMAALRAVWQNFQAGEIVSGGSTITQQVVRNLIGVNRRRTVPQKIKESLLAIKLSQFVPKDKVLEIYMNSIYFGGMAYGAEAAARQYFNKSAAQLDLAECAFLAGLPQAPNRYFPFKNFETAKGRQESVLKAMLDQQFITESEFGLAKEESIRLKPQLTAKKAPHFVDFVLSEGRSMAPEALQGAGSLGHTRGRLRRGASNVNILKTTLDLGLQARVENILFWDVQFLAKYNIENAAAVILDVKMGAILAMVGSVDYNNSSIDGAVNVTTSLRQPGSSIKPLLYAAAFEKGWNSETKIADEPIQFSTPEGLPYSPQNYDLKYHGTVSAAQALGQSLNVPAVKTLDYAGIPNFMHFAGTLGITSWKESPSHYGLSLALGSGEVRLLDLTNAYAAFARRGEYLPYRFLEDGKESSVNPEGADGHPRLQGVGERVMSSQTAAEISSILSDNSLRMPAFGEENPLKFSFPVAAKTGTSRNFRDNWTIGYTDDYAVGVWAGNSRGEFIEGVSGIAGAAPIFHKILQMLHESDGTELRVGRVEGEGARDIEGASATGGLARLQYHAIGESARAGLPDFRILTPFANDLFLFDPSKPAHNQKIRLRASEPAEWFVDNRFIGSGKEVLWALAWGEHTIKATHGTDERAVRLNVK